MTIREVGQSTPASPGISTQGSEQHRHNSSSLETQAPGYADRAIQTFAKLGDYSPQATRPSPTDADEEFALEVLKTVADKVGTKTSNTVGVLGSGYQAARDITEVARSAQEDLRKGDRQMTGTMATIMTKTGKGLLYAGVGVGAGLAVGISAPAWILAGTTALVFTGVEAIGLAPGLSNKLDTALHNASTKFLGLFSPKNLRRAFGR